MCDVSERPCMERQLVRHPVVESELHRRVGAEIRSVLEPPPVVKAGLEGMRARDVGSRSSPEERVILRAMGLPRRAIEQVGRLLQHADHLRAGAARWEVDVRLRPLCQTPMSDEGRVEKQPVGDRGRPVAKQKPLRVVRHIVHHPRFRRDRRGQASRAIADVRGVVTDCELMPRGRLPRLVLRADGETRRGCAFP